MQFRPMTIRTTAKSPAFLRASLVLAATSSFLPAVFSCFLSVCLLGYYEWEISTNEICSSNLYIIYSENATTTKISNEILSNTREQCDEHDLLDDAVVSFFLSFFSCIFFLWNNRSIQNTHAHIKQKTSLTSTIYGDVIICLMNI